MSSLKLGTISGRFAHKPEDAFVWIVEQHPYLDRVTSDINVILGTNSTPRNDGVHVS